VTGATPPPGAGDGPVARFRLTDVQLTAVFVVTALVLTPLLARSPDVGLALVVVLLLTLVAVLRPVPTLIAYVAVTPLVVGLARGGLVASLRLNEILLVPVVAGLTLVTAHRWQRSGWRRPDGFHRLDAVVLVLAFTSSVTTLLWMYARSRDVQLDDILYALALWKLAAVYTLVRLFIRDARALRTLLVSVLATTLLVGAIGALQALGVGPAIDLLAALVPPEDGGYDLGINRATSTLGNPIAYGDLLLYALVLAAALALQNGRRSRPMWLVAAALAFFALASGQASTALGLVTAAVAFAVTTGTARRVALAGIGLATVAAVALQPVLAARTGATDQDTGLPVSWTGRYGRLDNLQQYFWPEIGTDLNWLFGVRTSSRVPGVESWREWVYIESGYTWALWNGGLPLLAAVLTLVVVAIRTGRRLTATSRGVPRAVGITLAVVPWALAVLMFLDPHLTLRGGADLLFVVLALGATLDSARDERPPVSPLRAATPREPLITVKS
jgi:hypothetical protein